MTNEEQRELDKLTCNQFADSVLENMHNDAPMNGMNISKEKIEFDTAKMKSEGYATEETLAKNAKGQISPVSNKHCNRVMKADGCLDLPVFYDGSIIVIQWKIPFLQRLKVLFSGTIWHLVHTKELAIQPVAFVVDNPMMED
jgi:hypothetical protein